MKKIEKYCLVLAKYYLELLALVRYCNELIQTNHCVNTVIPTSFLVWRICGEALCRNYAETVPFHKISTQGI